MGCSLLGWHHILITSYLPELGVVPNMRLVQKVQPGGGLSEIPGEGPRHDRVPRGDEPERRRMGQPHRGSAASAINVRLQPTGQKRRVDQGKLSSHQARWELRIESCHSSCVYRITPEHTRVGRHFIPAPGAYIIWLPVFRALAVFWVYVLRILRVLAVFRGAILRILPDSQYFGIRYRCGYYLYLQVFRASVLRVLQVWCQKL